ncbi:hypothetical protein, partial [Microbacterium sp. Leaf351]
PTRPAHRRGLAHPRLAEVGLAAAAVIVTIAIATARLLVSPSFYFADDTQLGSVGIWHELGVLAQSGTFPILNPHAWQGGNYFAEGQWGLFNPLAWVIGIGSVATTNILGYVTVVKIAALGCFSAGSFLVARSYGASAWWSAAAAVIIPTAGFTVYMDAPSWVSGLFNAAAFAFTWWGVRRIRVGGGPLPYLISAYLLITFGYVFGVIMLVLLLVISIADAAVRREWRAVRRLAYASVFGALVSVAVFLPGVLTAGVTARGTTRILQTWFLNADLSDFGGIASPTATMSIGAWWGPATHAPMMSISWALPLAIAFWGVLRRGWRDLVVPLVLAAVAVAIIIGPDQIGPIRWPVRFLPYLTVAIVIVWAVMLTRGFPQKLGRRGLTAMLIVTLALGYLAWTQTPTAKVLAGTFLATTIALVAIYLIGTQRRWNWPPGTRSAIAAIVVVAGTISVTVPQLYEYRTTPLPTFATPTTADPMEKVLTDGVNDGFVVGDVYSGVGDPASFDELLVGNLWYFSPTEVSNVYTVLPYTAFTNDLCIDLRGSTCETAYATLLSTDPTTGRVVADLLGVNTIIATRATYPTAPPAAPGWHLMRSGSTVWVYERDTPGPTAGGVVATSAGTQVTVTSESDTDVTLRIDALGSDPSATLSRLAYPGYSVSGAALAAPVRGYLLTVDLSHASVGQIVTISFRPPGWTLELTSLAIAVVLGIWWPISRVFIARRRSARAPREHAESLH